MTQKDKKQECKKCGRVFGTVRIIHQKKPTFSCGLYEKRLNILIIYNHN